MKLFSIFKSRDKPVTNRTAGSAYSFFMGGSSSGKNVNERTAMLHETHAKEENNGKEN